jgi:hypothetical protein
MRTWTSHTHWRTAGGLPASIIPMRLTVAMRLAGFHVAVIR